MLCSRVCDHYLVKKYNSAKRICCMKVHVLSSQKYKLSENCLFTFGGTDVTLACYVAKIILPLLSPSKNTQFGCWE